MYTLMSVSYNQFERASPFTYSKKNIDRQLKLLSKEFDNKWLEANGTHPLQKLWRRKDQVSTLELYTFSRGVEKIKAIDERWFKHQKGVILHENINNRKGAFWEIIGAYYLMDPKNRVVPASISQKGFDLTSIINDTGKEIKYSLKYFSFSQHYKKFIAKCEEAKQKLLKKIREKNLNLQILISKKNNYPSSKDWNDFDEIVGAILLKLDNNETDFGGIVDSWLIGCHRLPDKIEEHKLSNKVSSFTLLIHIPYHKNERNNLLSKIHDAISNLENANVKENKNEINSLFIHIPTTASIKQCDEWILDYFKQIGRNPISNIILYQPSINFDFKSKRTYLQHCLHIIQNGGSYDLWYENDARNRPEFWFETGVFIQKPFQHLVVIGGNTYDMSNTYSYQTGDIFVEPKELDKNKLFARFGKYAGGIRIHTSYKSKIITTPIESHDELLIL